MILRKLILLTPRRAMKCLRIQLVRKNTRTQSRLSNKSRTRLQLYRRRFPEAAADECNDIVMFNPITRRITFKNLVRSRYLIAAPNNAFIISMFGQEARSEKICASSQREIDVHPVETDNSAHSQNRIRNTLPAIEKVNLRTLDNVFIYTT